MRFATCTALLLSLGLALPAVAMDAGLSAGTTAGTAGSAAGSSGNTTSTAGGEDERNAGDETSAGKGAKADGQAKGKASNAKKLRKLEEHQDDVVDSAAGQPGSTSDTLGVDVKASGRAGSSGDRSRDRQ